jgi:hypothetical protein
MAIPSINDLNKYINSKLTGLNWNNNLQQIVKWFTDGTADVKFNSVESNITGNVIGNVTGDLTGDVYASNGTSKILDNGTNGTDAIFTGNVLGDVTGNVTGNVTTDLIQTKTASGNLIVKNQGGDAIATLKNDKSVEFSEKVLTKDFETTGLSKIKGISNGTSVSAGNILEVIEYTHTAATIVGSTTLGTFTDALANCILTAGIWDINIICFTSIVWASGTGFVYPSVALTDNSNNIIRQTLGNKIYENSEYSMHCINYKVSISSSTTYKIRFTALASGSPVISANEMIAASTIPILFTAIRIG